MATAGYLASGTGHWVGGASTDASGLPLVGWSRTGAEGTRGWRSRSILPPADGRDALPDSAASRRGRPRPMLPSSSGSPAFVGRLPNAVSPTSLVRSVAPGLWWHDAAGEAR
jgi:hypothetical protein